MSQSHPYQPYTLVQAYTTKDGSEIRELMHPDVHGNLNQSLAEATIPVRGKTLLHQHRLTEEIYHITQGMGTMTLGTKVFEVRIGDSVCIPPGTPHCIENTGSMPLVLLCCCSPAYSHEDTDLVSTLL
ncbi:MAG: hypothetical protein RLZ25_1703 [Pseudomonadota bacterium]